jgi:hypothetical protein
MNKLIKASLIAIAFVFAAGCATHQQPVQKEPVVKEKKCHHPSRHCKSKHCVDKLGTKYESAK